MKKIGIAFLGLLMCTAVLAQLPTKTYVLIHTNMGDMKILLYNETPLHRNNFIKLVKMHYFDSLLFHRVIKEFMIQGGDPTSKHAPSGKQLGNGGPKYSIPSEFNPLLFHKKGALAAARNGDDVNPTKASSGSQFYIVQGQIYDDERLNQIEVRVNQMQKINRMRTFINLPENKKWKDSLTVYQRLKENFKMDSIQNFISVLVDEKYKNVPPFSFSPEQKMAYRTIGGTPFLDMNYTVFGEVVEGLDVLDAIAAVKTGPANRPIEDVVILSVELLKTP